MPNCIFQRLSETILKHFSKLSNIMPFGQKKSNSKKQQQQKKQQDRGGSAPTTPAGDRHGPQTPAVTKPFQRPDTAYNRPLWKQSLRPHSHSNGFSRKTGIPSLPFTMSRLSGTWLTTSGKSPTAEIQTFLDSPRSPAQITLSNIAASQDPAKAASAQCAPRSRWISGSPK